MFLESLLLLPLFLVSAYIWFYVVKPRRTLLLNLPGPPSTDFLFGTLQGIIKEEPGVKHDRWIESYGLTYRFVELALSASFPLLPALLSVSLLTFVRFSSSDRYDVLAGEVRLFTADPRAMNQ